VGLGPYTVASHLINTILGKPQSQQVSFLFTKICQFHLIERSSSVNAYSSRTSTSTRVQVLKYFPRFFQDFTHFIL
jgi:hypothetical protein